MSILLLFGSALRLDTIQSDDVTYRGQRHPSCNRRNMPRIRRLLVGRLWDSF
jgi:hypothetical protein